MGQNHKDHYLEQKRQPAPDTIPKPRSKSKPTRRHLEQKRNALIEDRNRWISLTGPMAQRMTAGLIADCNKKIQAIDEKLAKMKS